MSASLTTTSQPAAPQGKTVDVYPGDVDDQHSTMVRWFEESEMARLDEIANAEQARSYYDGVQWSDAEIRSLKDRGQPPVVINKISLKVALLCGLSLSAISSTCVARWSISRFENSQRYEVKE